MSVVVAIGNYVPLCSVPRLYQHEAFVHLLELKQAEGMGKEILWKESRL